MSDTFMDRCVRGEEKPENVGTYLDTFNCSMHASVPAYLGMSTTEWHIFVQCPTSIHKIVEARRRADAIHKS